MSEHLRIVDRSGSLSGLSTSTGPGMIAAARPKALASAILKRYLFAADFQSSEAKPLGERRVRDRINMTDEDISREIVHRHATMSRADKFTAGTLRSRDGMLALEYASVV